VSFRQSAAAARRLFLLWPVPADRSYAAWNGVHQSSSISTSDVFISAQTGRPSRKFSFDFPEPTESVFGDHRFSYDSPREENALLARSRAKMVAKGNGD